MGLLQFNVSVGEKTRPIHIQESAGVDELFRKVSADCANGVDPQDIRLVFGDVQLDYNQNKSFKDYSLVHMSTLTLLVRLHGGGNKPTNATQQESTSPPTQRATISEQRVVQLREISERVVQLKKLLEQRAVQLQETSEQRVVQLQEFSEQRVVQLQEIKTWTEYYDNDKEEIKKCLRAKGNSWRQEFDSEYPLDSEINSKVSLFVGDITCLQVDGIVSSDNSDLTAATGGVSFRIRTVAGPWFERVAKAMKGCRAGEAMVTAGFDLPAKYVVHTIVPQKKEPELLESCYKNCLEEMKTWLMKSLAFPCIATGLYAYPRDKAVLVALKTVRVWLEEKKSKQQLDQVERIIFCLFTPEDIVLYRTWMQVFYPCPATSQSTSLQHIPVDEPGSRDLLPLPGFIETTTTEPDMIGSDEEGTVLAKMPCGHVIGPLSMTDYCRDLLAKGRYRFYCPSTTCNREWEYFLVRYVARLTPEEMHDIEKQISANYLKKAEGMQQCPGCQIWCFRASVKDRCVRCKMCTDANGKPFDFCWWCLKPWKATGPHKPCGNTGCDGKDARLKVLEMCPTKKINNCNDCPSVRGCPKCGMLIEHKDKCAHVDCTTCGDYGFCFICLTEKKNEKWQCSPWSSTVKCSLAPRQTTLPGSK